MTIEQGRRNFLKVMAATGGAALLISSWARRGYIDHRAADTTSVLALIEARFGLKPLQDRDARAYSLLDGLDFTQKPRAPTFG